MKTKSPPKIRRSLKIAVNFDTLTATVVTNGWRKKGWTTTTVYAKTPSQSYSSAY